MAPKRQNESEQGSDAKRQKMDQGSTRRPRAVPTPEVHVVPGPLVLSYGHLQEATSVNRNTPQAHLAHYARRWLARYRLAQLSLQPEDTQFALVFPDGQRRTLYLMSPPRMIAVRDEASGRWSRHQRDDLFDGPPPHSDDFYQRYLARNHLPPWFLRGGHLALLEDTDEARLLGVEVPEEHKTYVYTTKGWQQHPRHAELDWSSKKVVASLARWRDQINRRHGWPNLRSGTREVYAQDEKAWLEARVHEYLDAGCPYDIVETCCGFLERFGDRGERTEAGIASIMLRIKRVWRKGRGSGDGAVDEELEEEEEVSGSVEQDQDHVDEDEDGEEDAGSRDEPDGEHSDSDDSDWNPILVG